MAFIINEIFKEVEEEFKNFTYKTLEFDKFSKSYSLNKHRISICINKPEETIVLKITKAFSRKKNGYYHNYKSKLNKIYQLKDKQMMLNELRKHVKIIKIEDIFKK